MTLLLGGQDEHHVMLHRAAYTIFFPPTWTLSRTPIKAHHFVEFRKVVEEEEPYEHMLAVEKWRASCLRKLTTLSSFPGTTRNHRIKLKNRQDRNTLWGS